MQSARTRERLQSSRASRASTTPAKILNLALGFMAGKHLFLASEIGLFEHLAPGPSTLDELAARMGVPRRTLRIIADAMVALGLLDCDADRYQNSAAPQAYLSGQTTEDLRPLLALWNRISYPAMRQLAAGVLERAAPVGAEALHLRVSGKPDRSVASRPERQHAAEAVRPAW